MMKCDQQKLFMYINEVSFAIDDVVLFLDTHPENKQALDYYDNYKKIRKEAVAEYTKLYGPLSVDDVNSCNYWAWIKEPWPWEPTGRGVCN